MIACKIHHLEARCRERGYTLEQALPCVVSRSGDDLVVDETHAAYPRERRGLGDFVAACLSAVGITDERVSRALGVKDCGCKKRREALNKIGRRFGLT